MGHILQIVQAANRSLSVDLPFVALGPVFNAAEAEILKSLHVSKTDAYDNFGALDRLEDDLTRFFLEIGNSSEAARKAASSITWFVTEGLDGLGAETAWITVRASNPTVAFDVPRWHCDGYYYSPYEGDSRKIVLTLKGPGTLLNLPSMPQRETFDKLINIPYENPDRSRIIAEALGGDHVIQAALHEPFLYIVGSIHAAIHSEPPIHEDRLFMSLVPGSTAQIAELRENWNVHLTSYSGPHQAAIAS